MAHTDRDYENWLRHNHGSHPNAGDCTYRPGRAWSPWWLAPPQRCETCDRIWTKRRFCISTDGYAAWSKAERKAERNKLRDQLRKARNGRIDWDDMPSGEGKIYRRPYYD